MNERNVTMSLFEEFRSGHRDKHTSIDKHIDVLHTRMWNFGRALVGGLFLVIVSLISYIVVTVFA